jgi:hypothetical protein
MFSSVVSHPAVRIFPFPSLSVEAALIAKLTLAVAMACFARELEGESEMARSDGLSFTYPTPSVPAPQINAQT